MKVVCQPFPTTRSVMICRLRREVPVTSVALVFLLSAFSASCDSTSTMDKGAVVPPPTEVAGGADIVPEVGGVDVPGDKLRDTKAAADIWWPYDTSPGLFGAPCLENNDCQSGWCVGWDEGHVCTELCMESCPEGWECKQILNTQPDLVFACHPAASHLCRPCASDYECGGGYCLEQGGEQRCSRSCPDSRACPAAFDCLERESAESGMRNP